MLLEQQLLNLYAHTEESVSRFLHLLISVVCPVALETGLNLTVMPGGGFCLKILTFCKRSLARSNSWFLKINWLLFKIRYPSYTPVTCTEILMSIFTWVLLSLHTLQMNHSLRNLITCSVKGVWLAELLIEVSFLQPSVVMELFLGLLCQVLPPQSIINDLLPSPAWVSTTQRETVGFSRCLHSSQVTCTMHTHRKADISCLFGNLSRQWQFT